ncbi:hypothetical protein JCM11491_002120 [Sporobolomyces phaffii]
MSRPEIDLETLRLFSQQLERAKSTIARLESQLATLPAFYASSPQLEIARLQSENDQMTRQAIALARKLQSARSGGGSVDFGTGANGDESGLKRENGMLLADVRHLERRLASSESETSRLASELRRLRPYCLQGSPLIVHDCQIVLPPEEASKPGSRAVLLGDAEAELLIQAGKKQSHVRRIQRIPLDKAIQDQAEDIVQAIVPLPIDPSSTTSRSRPRHPPPSRRSSIPLDLEDTRNALPYYQLPIPPSLWTSGPEDAQLPIHNPSHSANGGEQILPLGPPCVSSPTPPVRDGPPMQASTADPASARPGSEGGIADEYPPSAAAVTASSNLSPEPSSKKEDGTGGITRRKSPVDSGSTTHSASFSLPTVAPMSSTNPLHGSPVFSGLSDPTGNPLAQKEGPVQPALAGREVVGKPFGRTPSALDLLSEAAGAIGTSKYEAPSSINPRSRKPKLDANGEKKARSPYIKWNVEEDEQLLKAVIQCGCAWDSVAKLCPTRAYHQVRQRFLRGLRSGETLPSELMHLQAAVRKSVADYESRRKRKRPSRQMSAESQDQHDPLLAHYLAGQNLEDEDVAEDDAGDAMYDE